jgi:nucleoid-associated protein
MENPAGFAPLYHLQQGPGRPQAGDFFMDLLGAREGMDAKIQNKGLLQAVDDYCDSRQLEPAERNDYKKQVFKYCTEQASAGEEIEIKELSAELPGDGDLDFYSFIGQEYELEDRFRPTVRPCAA